MIHPGPSSSGHPEPGHRGDLIENLGNFCRFLREQGVPVALDKEINAASALLNIDLLDPQEFYLSMKATLLSRKKDEPVFDELFRLFGRIGAEAVYPDRRSSRSAKPPTRPVPFGKAWQRQGTTRNRMRGAKLEQAQKTG